MKNRSNSLLGLYTMGIAALFLAGFLLLVTFGAHTYRDAAGNQAENNESRALLSYLSTCVKNSDAAGEIWVTEDDYGPVLVIGDGSGYALHIYQKDGQLLEDYHRVGGPLFPEEAAVLGETDVFSVVTERGLMTITTDAGLVLLHLRSGEGPA